MRKYRYIQYLILLLFFIWVNHLFSASREWYNLYINDEITKLQKLNSNGNISDSDWQEFLNILNVENTDKSISAYVKLYDHSEDDYLRKCILDRISQYYYAKGFYETASRILEDRQFRHRMFSLKKKKIQFGVQLGAFSSYKNALKSKNRFSSHLEEVSIVTKNRNGSKLYVVIAGKLETKKDAVSMKKRILQRFDHKGIVIQY